MAPLVGIVIADFLYQVWKIIKKDAHDENEIDPKAIPKHKKVKNLNEYEFCSWKCLTDYYKLFTMIAEKDLFCCPSKWMLEIWISKKIFFRTGFGLPRGPP